MLSSASTKNRNRNRYRSARSVQRKQVQVPTHLVTKWTRVKVLLVGIATLVLATVTLLPIFLLEQTRTDNNFSAPVSLHGLLEKSIVLEEEYKKKGINFWNKAKKSLHIHIPGVPIIENVENHRHHQSSDLEPVAIQKDGASATTKPSTAKADAVVSASTNTNKNKNIINKNNNNNNLGGGKNGERSLARGVSGLPMSQTPALVGARPGHIQCDINVDDLAYWNDPQGTRDQNFKSPFATPPGRYITFEPDRGGWNNIRMSMEIIFVFAAATGRTLVLPPKAPFYLLGTGAEHAKSFGNFFPLSHPEFAKRLRVITMEEFLQEKGKDLVGLTDEQLESLKPASQMCLHKTGSEINCALINEHLRKAGFQPQMDAQKQCLIFDLDYFKTGNPVSKELREKVTRFCGERSSIFYDQAHHDPPLIHWNAGGKKGEGDYRLLNHFYAAVFFSDESIDNYYKRFVRDFLHYNDEIYCAAGKIVHALNQEGPWSSIHARRGDLQYKKVKIPAEEWYQNLKELWEENEILFIATDERNKTVFDDIKKRHPVRFLDDYWDVANLGSLESNNLGMIDTIVATHGRVFAGTWFSTFTGYINRMRGYLGYSMKDSWYGWLPRKDAMQEWRYPNGNYGAREWPLGWVAIDGDTVIEHEGTPVTVLATADGGLSEENNNNDIQDLPNPKKKIKFGMWNITIDTNFQAKSVRRGIAGRTISETPALIGAKRGHIECDINVDSLAYWNNPQGIRDNEFISPFSAILQDKEKEKYISFTVDRGGWNNVRMSMEIVFVIAAATGRTLVLPPKEPLYRLRADKKDIYRGFADFFPLDSLEFQKRVKMISMEEFVQREGGPNGCATIPDTMKEMVESSSRHCDKVKKSKSFCGHIGDYLAEVGYTPNARAQDYCFVFDKGLYETGQMSIESQASIDKFCGERKREYWTSEIQQHPLIHFRAGDKAYRLLTHFYGFLHFTDPSIGNYYKRFVRDYLHYNDVIYCAAGKIVKALQAEGEAKQRQQEQQQQHTSTIHPSYDDDDGSGGYSSMHIRRGDFQYKKVKISAREWYENTKEVWLPNEIIYIATDERNKTFFDDLLTGTTKNHTIKFLDDYHDVAQLDTIDPNYFGMIDTIVASRSRAFAGTWFSTFTGYINRMRGYHGISMNHSWYSYLDRKTKMHYWEDINSFTYAYEWPDGWIGIDADILPNKDIF